MTDVVRRWALRGLLVFWGLGCAAGIGVTGLIASFVHPSPSGPFQHVLQVFYLVLGLYLLAAVRDPSRYVSVIQFAVVSSVAHGALMATQVAVMQHPECMDMYLFASSPRLLVAETVALFLMALSLWWVRPVRMSAQLAAALPARITVDAGRLRLLRTVLGTWGVFFLAGIGMAALVYSIAAPYVGADVDQMVQSLYASLGVFLLLAARAPQQNISVLRFAIWSSALTALVMAGEALATGRSSPGGNMLLYRSIPLGVAALSLALLQPRDGVENAG